MKIALREMTYKNIRDFRDFSISLLSNDHNPYHISLIQMPNGTGKTTTISLIQNALYGKKFSEDEVKSFKPTRFDAADGSFELLYKINDGKYSIKLDFDYDLGDYKYSTSSPKTDGFSRGHELPPEINAIMTESFTKLFIFDGELANDLFNSSKTEAEGAIKSVFYLDRLPIIKNRIGDVLKRKIRQAKGTKIKDDRRIPALEKEVQKLEKEKHRMKTGLEKNKQEFSELNNELTQITESLRSTASEDEAFKKRYNKKNEQITDKERAIISNTEDLINSLRNPINWSGDLRKNMDDLRTNLIQLRLPKTAAKEFFTELAEGETCICGETLTKKKRLHITQMSKDYLADDATSVINGIKNSIRNMYPSDEQTSLFENISTLRTDLTALEQDKNLLEQESSNERRERFDKLNPRKDELVRKVSGLKDTIKYTETRDMQLINSLGLDCTVNLKMLDVEIKKAADKLATATDSVQFKAKCDALIQILSDSEKNAMRRIKQVLLEQTNQKINVILEDDGVAIDKISNSLIIQGKEGVSAGQSIAIGYSFISSLFENKLLELPFIIDSPAGPLDNTVRRKTANILPKLFHQLILFIIPSEKPAFVNYLAKNIEKKKGMQYFTSHKDKENVGNVIFKVNDLDYFNDFDIEEDD